MKNKIIYLVGFLILAGVQITNANQPPRLEEIKKLSHELEEETGHLQKMIDKFMTSNTSYWDSGHNKKDELKVIFEVQRFMASAVVFHDLTHGKDGNRIRYTYRFLAPALKILSYDLGELERKIDHLEENKSDHHHFYEHLEMNHILEDLDELRDLMDEMSKLINERPTNPGHGGRIVVTGRIENTSFSFSGRTDAEIEAQCFSFYNRHRIRSNVDDINAVAVNGTLVPGRTNGRIDGNRNRGHLRNGPSYWRSASAVCGQIVNAVFSGRRPLPRDGHRRPRSGGVGRR